MSEVVATTNAESVTVGDSKKEESAAAATVASETVDQLEFFASFASPPVLALGAAGLLLSLVATVAFLRRPSSTGSSMRS